MFGGRVEILLPISLKLFFLFAMAISFPEQFLHFGLWRTEMNWQLENSLILNDQKNRKI
jgi:hypothetical protein